MGVHKPNKRIEAPTEPQFHLGSDAERGIFEVVYKCVNCGDTDTERFFRDETPYVELGCSKCGAGLRGNPGGMYPMVAGNEELAN